MSSSKKNIIRLGVNIDHVATLRQVRGGTTSYPDLLQAAKSCQSGGAEQITIHLREDRRHIQDKDVKLLTKWRGLPINLEMAVTSEMYKKARLYRPDWVCLVPEKREELTTEGGLDLMKLAYKSKQRNQAVKMKSNSSRWLESKMTHKSGSKLTQNQESKRLQKNSKEVGIEDLIEGLQSVGIEVSVFIEPDLMQVQCAFELGVDAIEFHTGKWVLLKGSRKETEWKRLKEAAILTESLGMGVHAGHGLDYEHAKKITELPFLKEVNIGHSLVCYALQDGLTAAVKKMDQQLKKGRSNV